MSAVDEVRQLLGDLDPARDDQAADEERRVRDLARILASDRVVGAAKRPVPRRRLILLAAGAAVLAVAAGGVAVETMREPQPAYAATPPVLTYGPPVSAEPAGARLQLLAQIAARQPAPQRPAGTVEHLESANWFLDSSISADRTISAVVPEQWRSWRADDGAVRIVKKALPPTFRTDADRREWQSRGGRIDSTEEVDDYAAGEFYSRWQGAVPTDAAALRGWLTTGASRQRAPVQYLEDVAELAGVRLLNPAQRAAALRLLASLPGITATGTVTDRAGRTGEAFSITSDAHGLPAQYTVIVDPDSGRLLGYEAVLTTTAGKLNVTIPAVITYRSYLLAEYTARPR
ncbi:CU044_5270 family protein [Micromonospora sp. NBC_01655]|uniref:CU044_5270 family protein n=1 Tax=Micromonospora sp. NBC_01655 TaxID=2975983 RepID=UPI0022523E85|nr:CU044_5270 family protein [Micromonospora sp. NBC_01655]MCX4472474.1 CU044_5270 family protein [Micromonospora sp. NBC_01655]